jgi:hypothetical protein
MSNYRLLSLGSLDKYLGKKRPEDILVQIEERRALSAELKKVNEALKIIRRTIFLLTNREN